MEAIHLERTQVELDANSFVQDSFVHPAQIIEPCYSINIMLSRNVSHYFVKVLVLLVCESTDRVGAVPQRGVQIEEDRLRRHYARSLGPRRETDRFSSARVFDGRQGRAADVRPSLQPPGAPSTS